ncbi:MAG: DUF1553 domain-containing protein [Pirellulaceae bacterium]
MNRSAFAVSHWSAVLLIVVTLVVVTLVGWRIDGARAEPTPSVGGEIQFARDVAPLLEKHCIRCHQPGNEKGDLSLSTAADLTELGYVVPRQPTESYLIDVVRGAKGQRAAMPKEGDPLSAEEVAVLTRWIAEGAVWPREVVVREASKADASWWSLQPLADREPPKSPGAPASWRAHPIDRFVFAKLAEQGLSPNPPAQRRDLVRRLTYDLTGLPPTPEEIESFVADDSLGAYEELVDRLLASPHYGEHWGRHWLDVVRFGESNGFERNVIIDNLWPFRDYVIRSLNDDKPFDRLVMEHLAGDVIGRGDPQVEVGTAFLVCGPYDNVGNQDAVQAAVIRANTLDEIIRATGESFLGLTIGCARCHDHKFDPIRQSDYYGLYATFAGTRHGERVIASKEKQQDRAARLRPLNEQKAALTKERADLLAAIEQRARKNAEGIASRWTRPAVDRYGTEETFQPIEARYVRLVVESRDDNPDLRSGYHIDEFEVWTAEETPRNAALQTNGGQAEGASRVAEDFRDAYGPQLTIDGRFGARWIAAGPTLTITLPKPRRINRVVFSSDRPKSISPAHGKTVFVGDYRLEASLDGEKWIKVADGADRQPPSARHRRQRLIDATITPAETKQLARLKSELSRVEREIAQVPSLPSWWIGQFQAAPGPFHVFLGGDPQREGDVAVPTSLQVLRDRKGSYHLPPETEEGQRRLQLAKWITSPENPLTPRVLANRLWHYHFGTGIVATPSDFGYMGARPTHPALLDWLARQVHQHDWKLKPLHKMIVMSQAYRQSSDYRGEAAEKDADSRTLWRFPPRRLTGEEIRDTMLAVSGKLDKRMGGPGFRLYQYLQDNVATYVPLDEYGPETYRRSVYHQNARAAPVDMLSDFDCPDPAFAAPNRPATTTPLQALTLLNHDFTLDMAGYLAERVERETGEKNTAGKNTADTNTGDKNTGDKVQRTFLLTYGRRPEANEQKAAAALVETHGLRALCRALLNSNEFIYVR